MINMTNELRAKLLSANSVEEVDQFVKADGQEITAEEASELWKEIEAHKKDAELSIDELESVSGGADRDWLKQGCAATVEAGSRCRSNDFCSWIDVTYDHAPQTEMCPNCKINLYLESKTTTRTVYKCKTCPYTKEEQYMKDSH